MVRLRSWSWSAVATWMAMAVAVLSPTAAHAGFGFQPPSAEELAMKAEPKAPGAPAIILYRQVDRDDNGSTSHEDDYIRIKILTEEGRKYADIEIPFVKESGNISRIKARTIRPDGTIANYEGKVFDKTIVKAKGVKYLAKTLTLPDVQVGSVIEYFYTTDLSEDWIFDSHWILSQELFTKKAKFSLKPYHNDYSNMSVRWSWQGVDNPPKQDPDKVVRMEANDVKAFLAEDYMPPENELKSRVDFTYSSGILEKDQDKFWKQAGKKFYSGMDDFTNKRKAMEQAVAQIVSPGDTPEVKARKIYARVQQLRNVSFGVERTEQEKKRDKEKPQNNVEDVWKAGWGNGYGLTWLYLGLVKAAGLEAYGARISNRSEYFFNPNKLEDRKLDTNAVVVRLNGKEVYCDPGAAFTAFGELPWGETNVKGIRLDKDGGQWIMTPMTTSADARTERKAELKLDEESGSLEGKLVVTYTGLQAYELRDQERNQDEVSKKKYLENEIRESVPVTIEVELVNKPEWKDTSVPLVAEFTLRVPGWAMSAGKRALLATGLFSAAEKHVFDHAARTYPIYYEYPTLKVDDVTIELPAGWKVSSVPEALDRDLKAVAFSSKVESVKGKLHLTRSLRTDAMLLDTKYYSTVQSFYRMVRTTDEQQIVLLPGTSTASN